MSTSFSPREGKIDTITAAKTVRNDETGTSFVLNAAAGVAVTLPAAEAGLNYKFVVGAVFATTNWTVVAPANVIEGHALVAGAPVAAANENTISFVSTAESVGDYVDLISDGTSWFVSGSAVLAGGITFTAV